MVDQNNDEKQKNKDLAAAIKKAGSIFSGRPKEKEFFGATNTDPRSISKLEEPKSLQVHPDFMTLPVIPIREGILFPSTEAVLTFGRKLSLNAIRQAKKNNNKVILVAQKNHRTNDPQISDLYTVGTLVTIDRTLQTDDQVNALVRGEQRVKIEKFISQKPTMLALASKLHNRVEDKDILEGLINHLQKEFRRSIQMGKTVEFLNFMKLMSGVSDGELVDQIASTLDASTKQKQAILEELVIEKRARATIDLLTKELKVLEVEHDVASKTQRKFDKRMRESVLRERLETIQRELGEIEDEEDIIKEYQTKLKKAKIKRKDVQTKIDKEIKRLRSMSPNNPETGYIRSWLDTVLEIPWSKKSRDTLSINKATKVLDEQHHGLEKVKDRILEYISVLQLKKKNKKDKDQQLPTILCFVGPPGVGKTSIGKSIAKALGREFVKISLGGIRDEAEIRGHRRTYVGAMPGRIINGIRQAGTVNPVFMLDEIDKVGTDFRGDPSSALLEVLDPEQNDAFEDHYLDVSYDLSKVLFITTANTLDTIPPALRDRLEIVRYVGYTPEEKLAIGQNHLLKKVIENNGLKTSQLTLGEPELETIITRYTREAGVRNLERKLNTVARKAARQSLEKDQKSITITPKLLEEYLGPAGFDETQMEPKPEVGLAAGLAWTSVGGDMLFIEVALSPGKGKVQLTGKLGDVMKESAQAALTFVRANATKLGIDTKDIDNQDVHIHVPEGAVPKDGPSAGITITTAIVSAFTKKAVKNTVAMTGEVTLRGRVLRIGGLKEKSIAAYRGGVKTILFPADNERDLVEIPDAVKKHIKFIPVKTVDEVLEQVLTA